MNYMEGNGHARTEHAITTCKACLRLKVQPIHVFSPTMSVAPAVVFVVDDDPAIRRTLARLVGGAGLDARCFSSVLAFLTRHDPGVPGCLVADLAMAGLHGTGLQRELTGAGCRRPVIFLTGRPDVLSIVRAMREGAEDVLVKPVDPEGLMAVIKGAIVKDVAVRRASTQSEAVRTRLASLTPRESEVFRHVVAGRLNKQIAADLGAAIKTIKVHRGRVMHKLGVVSVADLVRMSERASIGPVQVIAAGSRALKEVQKAWVCQPTEPERGWGTLGGLQEARVSENRASEGGLPVVRSH